MNAPNSDRCKRIERRKNRHAYTTMVIICTGPNSPKRSNTCIGRPRWQTSVNLTLMMRWPFRMFKHRTTSSIHTPKIHEVSVFTCALCPFSAIPTSRNNSICLFALSEAHSNAQSARLANAFYLRTRQIRTNTRQANGARNLWTSFGSHMSATECHTQTQRIAPKTSVRRVRFMRTWTVSEWVANFYVCACCWLNQHLKCVRPLCAKMCVVYLFMYGITGQHTHTRTQTWGNIECDQDRICGAFL